jgi:hypothetical protein
MSGGWTVVDSVTNKSLPIQGTANSGANSPYFTPSPGQQDPVGKFRTSTPQALIDTDFEYGTQPTKWESIALQQNRQSVYYIPQQPLSTVTSIAGDGSTAVLTILATNTGGAAVGQPIFVQNALNSFANGWWYITAVSTNVSITCQITQGTTVPASNQYSAALTYVYLGIFYSNCGFQLTSTSAFTVSGTTTTVTTAQPHGLDRGSYIYAVGTGMTSTQMSATNGWISGTAMYLNAVPSAGLALRTGYSLTGAGVTGGTTITATNVTTRTAQIAGTVMSVTAGTAAVVGMQLSGTGVTAGTYVTAVNAATFVAAISGTALTYASGTIPTIGMVLTDSTTPGNLPAGVYIVSGTSPNFVLSAAGTTAAADTIVGTSYTVSASQTTASTTVTGYTYTVSASQTVGSIGSPVALSSTSTAAANLPGGAWVVATVPTANTLTYTTSYTPFGTITNGANNTTLFARPSGFVEPRTFDGGVAFSAGGAVPNQQLIRQTRRYFRYQSGKGIQFSTGSALKPALFITSITGAGTTATVTSRYSHNLTAGATIQVVGADQGVYNGNFTVLAVTSPTTFTYTTQIPITVATATGVAIRISPNTWYGSANRVGMFDLQNGMFFEYDGQKLYAVLRNSINQLNGTVAVTQNSSVVTGTGSQFATQLQPGSYVVIRGQSYRVVSIASNTSMFVSPEYRGATISNAIASITLDIRIPQSSWADPCNGTGPSGYNLDLTRMQMWYIDYSWYGAGVVRYGFRGTNGVITYVTQIQNNNRQFEAYMRTGNMASHYESNGISPITSLSANLSVGTATTMTSAITAGSLSIPLTSVADFNNTGVAQIGSEYVSYTGISGTTLIGCIRGYGNTVARGYPTSTSVTPSSIDVLDASRFPPAGTIKVTAAGQTGVSEYITYAGNDGSLFYGLTRAVIGGQVTAQAFTVSATTAIGVELTSPDTVPSLSHWGSSVIMDGQFDDDKSLIFNYGTTTAITTTSTSPIVILAIRVAPSVDNGTIGTFGNKEVINRMQLQLDSLGLYTTGTGYLINLVLNGFASGATSGSFIVPIQQPNGITSSLAQVATNTNAVTVTGGESVFAAYSNTSGNTTLDLSQVRDLGNSILGGGTTNTVPTSQAGFYPDGPDILYIVATPLTSTSSTILARLNWKEAQA